MSPGFVLNEALRLKSVAGLAALLPSVVFVACYYPEIIDIEGPIVSYVSVAAGDIHVCGLSDSGKIYCWMTDDPRPSLTPAPVSFVSIATTAGHGCALTEAGEAYCWGVNDVGQLGTTTDLSSCITAYAGSAASCSTVPVPVETDLVFESITVGAAHSCALDVDGRVHCWGLNTWGQLGADADTACALDMLPDGMPCSLTPVEVAGGHTFASLSSGNNHNCAVTPGGTAYCWGAGANGRLGTGSLENSAEPLVVVGGHSFSMVSAGGSHTCGLSTDGYAYCWGANASLQLGSKIYDPECGVQLSACVATPHRTNSDLRFRSIAASGTVFRSVGVHGAHTCGLTVDGKVHCWGLNENGQLGTHWDLTSADPVTLPVDVPFAEIDAGMMNTCGVGENRKTYCWPHGTPLEAWRVFDTSGSD